MDFSIVIPVKNESLNLPGLVNDIASACKPLGKSFEVVFIDDGSTDNTYGVIKDLAKQHDFIRALQFDRNYGKTAALEAGFEKAQGEVIIIMDGDRQNDPCDIPKFLEQIPPYDIVCGYRQKRLDSWFRLAQSRFANKIRNSITKDGVRDSGCGYQAFRKECLKKIKLHTGMHRFLPCLFQMQGFKFSQIPVKHHPRSAGVSNYPFFSRTLGPLNDLFAVRWMQNRKIDYRVKDTR